MLVFELFGNENFEEIEVVKGEGILTAASVAAGTAVAACDDSVSMEVDQGMKR